MSVIYTNNAAITASGSGRGKRQRGAHPALARSLALAAGLLLAACSIVPTDYPRTASEAIPASDDNRLGRVAAKWSSEHDQLSGFIPLHNGIEAFGARMRLIEIASASIDAQYFLMKRDRASSLFIGKLLRAADRGVRVRLLIDDIFTKDMDSDLSLLNSHENAEVRLFNPVSRTGWKYWNFVTNFKRANRRMHNKSFTADNSFTIVGGRNIADEYFQIRQDVEFIDAELLGIGAVAADISATFDLFWNSALALPIEAFGIEIEPEQLAYRLDEIARIVEGNADGVYTGAVNSPLLQNISAGLTVPTAASAVVVTDRPEKLKNASADVEYRELSAAFREHIDRASEQVLIVTPYLVPGKEGVKRMQQIIGRGVDITIVTNSLASTNHTVVHSGYARYRRRMLKAGVSLYEVKPQAQTQGDDERGIDAQTLHSKIVVLDRETLFMGSANFDPRSIALNTEMGIFIESAEIARDTADQILGDIDDWAYRVELNENNQLRWRDCEAGEGCELLTSEPETGLGKRLKVNLYRLLPIEGQL